MRPRGLGSDIRENRAPHDRSRFLKHLAVHKVADTELQVVSDLDSGVQAIVCIEKEVIERYTQDPEWQHGVITLFVLQDLEPLIRQLSQGGSVPPGGIQALKHRPIVNVYDLRNPYSCRIFINQVAMKREGYWDDQLAVRALLAHEHAHPLAECATTRSSRCLKVELSSDGLTAQLGDSEVWQGKIDGLLEVMVEKLCLYAPREVFANEVAIRSGFADALLYLDVQNVNKAAEGLRARQSLSQQLQKQVERGSLTTEGAHLLLTIADMKGYLDLALETAPFHRQERLTQAEELEGMLHEKVIPHLEPAVGRAYQRLRDGYVGLPTDASPRELAPTVESLVDILAAALRDKGLELGYEVGVVTEQEERGYCLEWD